MRRAAPCLLFGFPLTKAEFAARLAPLSANKASDYLARFAATDLEHEDWLAHVDQAWRSDYGPWVAAPYAALAERARALGCEVRQAATLADLADAASAERTVLVISHWKGAAFLNDDFLPGLEAELDVRLAERSDPLAVWLRGALQSSVALLGLWRRPPRSPRTALREAVTARISEPSPDGVQQLIELPTTTASRRRDLLDQWLEGLARPGNRLELFDGMHGKEAVVEAIAGLEAGVLDLVVCNGAYLGDYIGRQTRHRFRMVQALLPQDPTEAAFRLGAVLDLAAEAQWDYLWARLEVAKIFPHMVRAEARARKGDAA
ncbi:hypothetical protein BH10PSE3_BH10PSE3_31460 [soil metagenome]